MTRLRAERIAKIADDVPPLEVDDPDGADVLVIGWGSSYGPINGAARRLRREGKRIALAHLHHLNPLPSNTGEVVRSYRKVVVPEMNTGQLSKILRAEFLVDAESITKVEGLPFFTQDLEHQLLERLRP
jgi:2-oxoglutarate ferredoxin oxidoreductase subunit alpha